jgi:hypothetical protein
MKRNLAIVVFVAITVSGFAFAGGKHLSANVPFEFYVEDQLLPAGEYNFEMGGNTIVIRTKDGMGVRLLTAVSGANENRTGDYLQFNQYGGKLFLSSVATGSYKANVKTAKAEQEMRAQVENARQITLTAKK